MNVEQKHDNTQIILESAQDRLMRLSKDATARLKQEIQEKKTKRCGEKQLARAEKKATVIFRRIERHQKSLAFLAEKWFYLHAGMYIVQFRNAPEDLIALDAMVARRAKMIIAVIGMGNLFLMATSIILFLPSIMLLALIALVSTVFALFCLDDKLNILLGGRYLNAILFLWTRKTFLEEKHKELAKIKKI